jgi:predicted Zn-dependent peptidase
MSAPRALALAVLAGCASGGGGFSPHPPELGGLPVVFVPRYETSRLPNGVSLQLNSDPAIPLISVALGVRGGPLTEPLAKAGVTALLASTMTIRTERLDRFQLAAAYDAVGDGIRVRLHPDGIVFQLDVLAENAAAAIAVLAEVARRPVFDEALLERAHDDELSALSALESDPRALAIQGLRQVVFGTGHRLGLPVSGTRRTLALVSVADLRARYGELFRPENVVLAICGRMTAEVGRTFVERAFGDWRSAGPPPGRPAPPPKVRARQAIHYIARPGLAQTVIYAGRAGPPQSDDRYELIRIANRRVASSAGSWLRGVESITYGVSALEESTSLTGLYGASTQVDARATGHAVKAILDRFDSRPGGFGFDREKVLLLTGEALAQYRFAGRARYTAELFLRGLPLDHWNKLREKLDGVRDYHMEPVVFEFIRSDAIQVVLVGDPVAIGGQGLSGLQELRLAID